MGPVTPPPRLLPCPEPLGSRMAAGWLPLPTRFCATVHFLSSRPLSGHWTEGEPGPHQDCSSALAQPRSCRAPRDPVWGTVLLIDNSRNSRPRGCSGGAGQLSRRCSATARRGPPGSSGRTGGCRGPGPTRGSQSLQQRPQSSGAGAGGSGVGWGGLGRVVGLGVGLGSLLLMILMPSVFRKKQRSEK